MRMYILVRDDVPLGLAMAAVGHATLACYLKFKDQPETQTWLDTSFRKCVCRVNAKQFNNAKAFPQHVVVTESALAGVETALAFMPRSDADWPKDFKFYPLYKEGPGTLTAEQTAAVKCAYADLVGAIQARNQKDIEVHDWKAHEVSIHEVEEAFPAFIEPAKKLT